MIAGAEWLLAVSATGVRSSSAASRSSRRAPATGSTVDRLQRNLEESLSFLRDLRSIEERAGQPLPLPPQEAITELDLAAVETSAEILRTGRGTATFQRGTQRVAVNEITEIAERRSGSEVERDVEYESSESGTPRPAKTGLRADARAFLKAARPA